MSSPARRPHEQTMLEETMDDTIVGEYGWPQPRELGQPSPPRGEPRAGRPLRREPPRTRRRSRLGRVWILLAVLGVVLAAVAGVWYSRLGGGAPSQLTVPAVTGLKESAAIHKLTTLGLAVRSVEMPASSKEGLVFRQRPAAGTTLERGTAVTIDVASGK